MKLGPRDLRLSWLQHCLSILQGMSLDCVEISLGRVFASGQAYVALSRARSLHGLRVLDFDPMVVRCDPQVLNFYATLQQGRGLSLVRGSHPVVGHVAVGRLGAKTEGRPRDPEVGGGRAFSGSSGGRDKRTEMLAPGCGPGDRANP